jgi:ribonucleoside-diphosphate reductase alpha chain
LPADIQEDIGRHGIRNALVTSIAPTGTISLLADNVSSGLEPVFRFSYGRKVLQPDGTSHSEEVSDPAYRLFREMHGEDTALPPAFVDVSLLEPSAHLVMQAACQRHIDAAVSKTLNLPRDISFEAFRDIYSQAYDLGCKGCTTYRPNEITGAVLEEEPTPLAPRTQPERDENASIVYMARPLERPEVLPGRTYKLRWPESDHAIYITINDVVRDGRRRPFEIFMNSKNMEHYAWALALTRMISAVFRRGGDVSFVVDELKAVFDPRGGAWIDGKYLPSLLAAIGQIVEEHMIAIGFLTESSAPRRPLALAAGGDDAAKGGMAAEELTAVRPRQCPKCGSAALIRQEGCDLCTACAYSRCV